MGTDTELVLRPPEVAAGGPPVGRRAARGRVVAWTITRGLLAGIVLGVAYRAWMRLIAPDPSFTWGGTIAILVIVSVATLAASLCSVARARWRRRWARGVVRVVAAALIVLALGTPPGTVTVPAFVLAALAWGRRRWPRRLRAVLALLAVVLTVVTPFLDVIEFSALPMWRGVAGMAGFVVIVAVSAWLFAVPTRSPEPVSTAAREAQKP